MRGRQDSQVTLLAFIDLETRVPSNDPLRVIKRLADQALKALSPDLDRMYANVGRPSIPPERLLKSSLLIALYSVRSERAFCEQLDYNLLFRWFLDMNVIEPSFDATTFTKNRERLLRHGVGHALFGEVVLEADRQGLLPDEHFTVDGILGEAGTVIQSLCRFRGLHLRGLIPILAAALVSAMLGSALQMSDGFLQLYQWLVNRLVLELLRLSGTLIFALM